uniref:Otopetrin 2 n=1 Tax=Podarcis muralis TaxID=64176 RepID=A0A670JBB8_PODMU
MLAGGSECPSPSPHSSKEVWKKGGRVFSILLAINLVLLSCTLVSGGAFQEVKLHDYDVFFMLIIVMLINIAWMLFYIFRTSRLQGAIPCKDNHAGPIWLRGGLVLFAVLSLVMDAFKTGYYSSYYKCLSPIRIMFPVVQGVFVITQTVFLWMSAQDCIHKHLNLTRCGLMLTLTTNLAVWMAAVTDESVHKAESKNPIANVTHRMENCACKSQLCKIFQNGYYWLYPFNIEYSLFASAMVYVMWKNVGRLIDPHDNHIHQLKFKLFRRTYFLGTIVGFLVLVTGIAVLIVYEIQVNSKEDSKRTDQVLTMYYGFNIVCLSLMSAICIAGSIVYRFDKRDMDHHKNPTRTLDVALLMGAALGQYAISYYSIVATVASSPRDTINALNLSYSLLMLAQPTFQNIFIIEGLHRQPQKRKTNLSALPPSALPGLAIQTSEARRSLKASKKMNWRRRFLKEISVFLLLGNAILWVMPAFGARPQFDNKTELAFYGYPMWAAIVDICLPFGIFYRMHAVASLLEVYIMS